MFFGNLSNEIGFTGFDGFSFATGIGNATPTRLGGDQVVDSNLNYVTDGNTSEFLFEGNVSPDFGPGSYMGFKTAGSLYGYFEVTWSASTNQFQILSAAYENTGLPISTPTAVPESSDTACLVGAVMVLVALRRRFSHRRSCN